MLRASEAYSRARSARAICSTPGSDSETVYAAAETPPAAAAAASGGKKWRAGSARMDARMKRSIQFHADAKYLVGTCGLGFHADANHRAMRQWVPLGHALIGSRGALRHRSAAAQMYGGGMGSYEAPHPRSPLRRDSASSDPTKKGQPASSSAVEPMKRGEVVPGMWVGCCYGGGYVVAGAVVVGAKGGRRAACAGCSTGQPHGQCRCRPFGPSPWTRGEVCAKRKGLAKQG